MILRENAMNTVLLFDVGETILDAVGQQDALMEVHRTTLARFGFKMSVEEYRHLDSEKISQFVPSPMHAITRHFAGSDAYTRSPDQHLQGSFVKQPRRDERSSNEDS